MTGRPPPTRLMALLAAIGLATISAVGFAADDPDAAQAEDNADDTKALMTLGEKLVSEGNGEGAAACMACHGKDGAGKDGPGYPRLSGMNADYMARQLADIAAGDRENAIMKPIASALSERERRAASLYYASQPVTDVEVEADPETVEQGRMLGSYGDWSNKIPACTSCHGPGGRGVGSTFPAIAGQHPTYIEAQLKAWKSGKRHNDPNSLMKVVAQRLDAAEIEAVAAYFAGLPTTSQTSDDSSNSTSTE